MFRTSSYYNNLIETVLNLSESGDWLSAVTEWSIDDVEEDESLAESCVCGKETSLSLYHLRC